MYQLRKDLGMSWWDIHWGESWINIKMMLADAPQYHPPKDKKDDNEPVEEMTDDDLLELADKL